MATTALAVGTRATTDTRERILATAYELFSRHGIRAVGVDTIVQRSGVAKMTLYRHFSSKDELALEFLRRREERWTHGWLAAEVTSRAEDPAERLLAVFDVLDEWFRTDDFEGCSFVNALLETTSLDHPVRRASADHLASIRGFLQLLASAAGVRDPEGFARQWHILMKGSIVSAAEGDVDAARRAQAVGELLLEHELAAV